jgi:hypothetical protein
MESECLGCFGTKVQIDFHAAEPYAYPCPMCVVIETEENNEGRRLPEPP